MTTRYRITPITAIMAIVVCSSSAAQSQSFKEIEQGKPLPTVSATAASGRWQERAAFQLETYGKARGVSPANSNTPKIVLYTSALSEDFFRIARAVDRYVGVHPELDWSFVQISDAKGAQQGGYTAEELRIRLAEIREQAKKHGINHLSFLVAAPGTGAPTPDPTVVIAHVPAPDAPGKPYKSGPVDWMTRGSAASLQGDTLSRKISEMDLAIRPRKQGKQRPSSEN